MDSAIFVEATVSSVLLVFETSGTLSSRSIVIACVVSTCSDCGAPVGIEIAAVVSITVGEGIVAFVGGTYAD